MTPGSADARGALSGIRVLDLSHQLAGPFCTMILADLGADVCKIERPGGGDFSRNGAGYGRKVDGVRGYFASINRNKRSIVVDLKCSTGRDLAIRLADQADVLVENMSPGTMGGLGLGYADIAARNPRLVYASCSGFGQTGEQKHRRGADPVIQAISGAMSITGEPDGPPARVGFSFGDICAGMWLALGVLGALVERSSSGKGQYLDISMMDCAVALLENAVMRYLWDGQVPQRLGRRHPQVPGTGAFETDGGHIVLTSLSDANWPQLCTGLERPDLVADPRFATRDLRHANRVELDEVLAAHVKTHTTRYWLDRLEPLGALASPVNTIPEMLEEPSVRDRQLIQEVVQQQGTVMPLVASPLRMSRTPASIRFAAPLLAQHEHELLRDWLGVDDDEFAVLDQRGAFADHA
jgi:crotonobetainyl-CoA:carnitine CoA-transferase CaiB-like acyl-CoA transferase